MKLGDVGNGMLFPPSWYGSPPDPPDPPEPDERPATPAELRAMAEGTEWWLADDERDDLAERGAFDRDDECRICGAPLDGPCWPGCRERVRA